MSKTTYYREHSDVGHYADTAHEVDKPTHSKLLGPDGKPLQYQEHKIGFDLSRRKIS